MIVTMNVPKWRLEWWVLMVMFVLIATRSGDRSFVDAAPVGEVVPDGDSNISDANDLDVQQLENLKHSLGKTLEIMKSHSAIYADINGHRQAHATTKQQVKTDGELFAQINQNVDHEDDIHNKERKPLTKIQTEVNIPSKGIHKTIVQEKTVDDEENSESPSIMDVMDVADLTDEINEQREQSKQSTSAYTLPLMWKSASEFNQHHQQQQQQQQTAARHHSQDVQKKNSGVGEILLPSSSMSGSSSSSSSSSSGLGSGNGAIIISSGNGGSGAGASVMDNGNGGARRITSSPDQDNVNNNNIEPYNTYLSSVQYSPLDMAEYIFWTGDEKGVTLAIEEFLRDGLMTPDEAIAFLQEIKFNLEYLQAHYSQPSVHSPDPQRLEQSKEHAYNLQRNDKFSGTLPNQLMDDPTNKHVYDISDLRQNIEKKNGGYDYNPTEKSKIITKPNSDQDSMSDEEYGVLLERLRVADFLYTQYSLEEVIYQLAKVMFSQSLTRGSAEAQQALQKFTSFLESETAQGHISRSLEKKVLDVLIAALTDTLTEHPELVTAAREGLSGGTTPHLPAGNDILKQILEMTPEEREILKSSQQQQQDQQQQGQRRQTLATSAGAQSSSSSSSDRTTADRERGECCNNNHHHHPNVDRNVDDMNTTAERVQSTAQFDGINGMEKYKT